MDKHLEKRQDEHSTVMWARMSQSQSMADLMKGEEGVDETTKPSISTSSIGRLAGPGTPSTSGTDEFSQELGDLVEQLSRSTFEGPVCPKNDQQIDSPPTLELRDLIMEMIITASSGQQEIPKQDQDQWSHQPTHHQHHRPLESKQQLSPTKVNLQTIITQLELLEQSHCGDPIKFGDQLSHVQHQLARLVETQIDNASNATHSLNSSQQHLPPFPVHQCYPAHYERNISNAQSIKPVDYFGYDDCSQDSTPWPRLLASISSATLVSDCSTGPSSHKERWTECPLLNYDSWM